MREILMRSPLTTLTAVIVTMALVGCSEAASEGPEDVPLENSWAVEYRYVENKSGSYGPFEFTYPTSVEDSDFDGDGSVEQVNLTWFYEFAASGEYNLYRRYEYIDPATQTAWQNEFSTQEPAIEAGTTLLHDTSKSGTYTSDGSTITILANDGQTTSLSYTISGSKLSIAFETTNTIEEARYSLATGEVATGDAVDF